MTSSTLSVWQERRLFQVGMLLFLLALLVGLAIPFFAIPRLALSAHLLGLLQGLFLVVLGLLWSKLALKRAASVVAFWLAVYGCVAAWVANVLAAIWGAGSAMLPIAAGHARGSVLQELLISIVLRTAAVSLISVLVLILWGLRGGGGEQAGK